MLNVILWKCISPILTAHNIGHFRVDPSLEAECEAYNVRIFFLNLKQISLIFARQVLHLAKF